MEKERPLKPNDPSPHKVQNDYTNDLIADINAFDENEVRAKARAAK